MNTSTTLFESENYTMASSWLSEIRVNPTANGGCILMAWVHCPDLVDISPCRYRSGIIKTAKGFRGSWAKCCEALDEEADIDEEVITRLEPVCPLVVQAMRQLDS
jgi:hypothetical protein